MYTESMYSRVGLGRVLADAESAERKERGLSAPVVEFRVDDSHHDMGVQRELSGITEGRVQVPITTGVFPVTRDQRRGMLDEAEMTSLSGMGIRPALPRLYESSVGLGVAENALIRGRIAEMKQDAAQLAMMIGELESALEAANRGESRGIEVLRRLGALSEAVQICEKCGTQYEGKMCESCGAKHEGKGLPTLKGKQTGRKKSYLVRRGA